MEHKHHGILEQVMMVYGLVKMKLMEHGMQVHLKQ
jgi:hypothetical protein